MYSVYLNFKDKCENEKQNDKLTFYTLTRRNVRIFKDFGSQSYSQKAKKSNITANLIHLSTRQGRAQLWRAAVHTQFSWPPYFPRGKAWFSMEKFVYRT